MTDTSRRDFLKSTSIGAASLALAGADIAQAADAGDQSISDVAPAFAPHLQPRPLGFDPAKLKGMSEKLIRSHWDNNYSGSVKTLNAVKLKLSAALADKDTPPFVYGDLKREHLMRNGSVVLHELYFDNLGGDGKADAASRTAFFGASLGSFDNWETEFRKIAASLGGGSGWVVSGYSAHTGLIENFWMPDHLHFPAGNVPLLVMDMYEHAYALDYGAAAAKYIDAFFQNVRWDAVSARLAAVRGPAATA
jgi:Fe-Mn family superoxide dismutase